MRCSILPACALCEPAGCACRDPAVAHAVSAGKRDAGALPRVGVNAPDTTPLVSPLCRALLWPKEHALGYAANLVSLQRFLGKTETQLNTNNLTLTLLCASHVSGEFLFL